MSDQPERVDPTSKKSRPGTETLRKISTLLKHGSTARPQMISNIAHREQRGKCVEKYMQFSASYMQMHEGQLESGRLHKNFDDARDKSADPKNSAYPGLAVSTGRHHDALTRHENAMAQKELQHAALLDETAMAYHIHDRDYGHKEDGPLTIRADNIKEHATRAGHPHPGKYVRQHREHEVHMKKSGLADPRDRAIYSRQQELGYMSERPQHREAHTAPHIYERHSSSPAHPLVPLPPRVPSFTLDQTGSSQHRQGPSQQPEHNPVEHRYDSPPQPQHHHNAALLQPQPQHPQDHYLQHPQAQHPHNNHVQQLPGTVSRAVSMTGLGDTADARRIDWNPHYAGTPAQPPVEQNPVRHEMPAYHPAEMPSGTPRKVSPPLVID